MKKTLSLILALAMMLSMNVFASATDVKQDGGTANVALEGKIDEEANLLSVVIPTSINFAVGTVEETTEQLASDKYNTTNLTTGGYVFNTFYSGTGKVINNSASQNVKIEITEVIDDASKLLDKIDLALSSTDLDETTALADPLEAGANQSIVLVNSLDAAGGEAELSTVGQAAYAVKGRDSYPVNLTAGTCTVTTVLKVSAAS